MAIWLPFGDQAMKNAPPSSRRVYVLSPPTMRSRLDGPTLHAGEFGRFRHQGHRAERAARGERLVRLAFRFIDLDQVFSGLRQLLRTDADHGFAAPRHLEFLRQQLD